MPQSKSRRDFIRNVGTGVAAAAMVAGEAAGREQVSAINVGLVGCGGRGPDVAEKMSKVPGPVWSGEKVSTTYNHEFMVTITDNYPYEKPIVRWRTDIFHPNIMPPKEDGHVCTKLLDTWNFSSNLLAFINGIESLLAEPNPGNPWGSKTCMEAARYFAKNEYRPPMIAQKRGPKIVAED